MARHGHMTARVHAAMHDTNHVPGAFTAEKRTAITHRNPDGTQEATRRTQRARAGSMRCTAQLSREMGVRDARAHARALTCMETLLIALQHPYPHTTASQHEALWTTPGTCNLHMQTRRHTATLASMPSTDGQCKSKSQGHLRKSNTYKERPTPVLHFAPQVTVHGVDISQLPGNRSTLDGARHIRPEQWRQPLMLNVWAGNSSCNPCQDPDFMGPILQA